MIVSTEEQVRSLIDLPKVPSSFLQLCLNKGEQGDVDLLAYLYQDKLAYDHSDGTWYFFDGISGWQKDRIKGIHRTVSEGLAGAYEGLEEIEAQRRAKTLRGMTRIGNVLRLAQSDPSLALTGDEWHHNPWLLPVENGVINLEDGSFGVAQPGDYLRIEVPTRWKGLEEPAPRFEQFMLEIFGGNTELVSFFQRLLGYTITGSATEQKVVFMIGNDGRNGKDTLMNLIKDLLGPFVGPVNAEVLVDNTRSPGSPQPHLTALRHMRMAWVDETDEQSRLNTAQVKMLTGGGFITARDMYSKPITFKPQYTLYLMTNYPPEANSADEALWERMVIIPFNERFIEEPSRPNEHLRDTHLGEKLEQEKSGVLAWIVRGALAWQESGLMPPEIVKVSAREYRSEQDDFTEFIESELEQDPDYQEKAVSLHQCYIDWAKLHRLRPITMTGFGRRLGKLFMKEHSRGGSFYKGVRIRRDGFS